MLRTVIRCGWVHSGRVLCNRRGFRYFFGVGLRFAGVSRGVDGVLGAFNCSNRSDRVDGKKLLPLYCDTG